MSFSLSPETQRLVEERLKNGAYTTLDELVHAALDALDQLEADDLDEEAIQAIDQSIAEATRGDVREWKDVREQLATFFRRD